MKKEIKNTAKSVKIWTSEVEKWAFFNRRG
jgi:hypothetical protein